MKKETTPKQTKRYKITFSPLIIILSILVIVLCVGGIALSAYRVCKFGIETPSDALKSPLLIAICVFCIVLMISILVKSQYTVDDKYYVTQFGFIKSKFLIKDITALELNTETYKLTVFVGEQFSVLSTSPTWNEDFVRALLAVNPNIDYSFTLADKPEEKKKK